MAKRFWLFNGIASGLNGLLTRLLAEEVEKFLVGTVGRNSNLSREMLLGAIKYDEPLR